jgi:hypothetical protein
MEEPAARLSDGRGSPWGLARQTTAGGLELLEGPPRARRAQRSGDLEPRLLVGERVSLGVVAGMADELRRARRQPGVSVDPLELPVVGPPAEHDSDLALLGVGDHVRAILAHAGAVVD